MFMRPTASPGARRADVRFHALFAHAPVGVALCTLDGTFVEVNASATALLAGTGTGRPGDSLHALAATSAEGRRWLDDLLDVVRGGREVARGDLPVRVVGRERPRWLHVTAVMLPPGSSPALLVHLDDVSGRRHEEERLEALALRDGLTGLANRTLLRRTLAAALDRSVEGPLRAGVLYVDLDHFKAVNDTLGHDAGDALLVAVAGRLSGTLRVGDLAGRVGGDEFVVVAEGFTGEAPLAELADRVRAALSGPVVAGGRRVELHASIGAVLARPDDDVESVLRRADAAMFADKRSRRVLRPGRDATPVGHGPRGHVALDRDEVPARA